MLSLYDIMEMYYADFAAKKDKLSKIVDKSFPIVWFGNMKKYFSSPIKVITIGLNPSLREFPETNRDLRFPGARDAFEKHRLFDVCNSLNGYFDVGRAPYWDWFEAYERALGFLKCGVTYGGIKSRCPFAENYAIHIDFFSAIATDPPFGRLDSNTKKQLKRIDLFESLFTYLTDGVEEPIVVLFSTSKVDVCDQFGLTQNTKMYECVEAGVSKVEAFRRGNQCFIWGKPNIQPFKWVRDEVLKHSLNEICTKIGV